MTTTIGTPNEHFSLYFVPDTELGISACVISASFHKHTLSSHSVLQLSPQASAPYAHLLHRDVVQGKTFMYRHTQPGQIHPQDFPSLHLNALLPGGRKGALIFVKKERSLDVYLSLVYFLQISGIILSTQGVFTSISEKAFQ